MAAPPGSGMYVVTQYIPAANAYPLQQGAAAAGQTPGFMQKFIKGEPKALGTVQIMIGLIDIFLGGILCVLRNSSTAVYSGVPFWGALFFFISGGLSISGEKKGNPCLVKGSLGMNIISAIAAGIGFIIYVVTLSVPIYGYWNNCNYYNYNYYSNNYECMQYLESSKSMHDGILAVLLILSVLEFCISISTSAFGCKSVCEDCCSQQAQQPMFVVQNAYDQDPRLHATQTPGMPGGQGFQVAPGMQGGQGFQVAPGMQGGQGFQVAPGMQGGQGFQVAPGMQGGQGFQVAPGMQLPQGMTVNYQGMPVGQGMPTSYGMPSAPGVSSAPMPTTEIPPSYYKNVPGDNP